jgi:GNAT superfamily N-acetyltransferase
VRPVRTFRDQRRFIAFPYTLYSSFPYWVAPLRRHQAQLLFSKKNLFFRHSRIAPFIAEDASGRVLGRIAAIVNGMHLRKHGDGTGFFGFFECVERYDVAVGLFDAVATYLRAQGLSVMRGPANPSINECSGLLVKGFDRTPATLMPYNPPYYEDFLLRYKFERAMTMWAYYGAWKHLNSERLRRGAEVVKQRMPGLRVRNPDMSRFAEEVGIMCGIYNQAFDAGWGHVPLSEAEFQHMAKAMRPALDPNLVFFLEHDGRPVGFSLSLPDINALLRHVPDGRLFPLGFLKLLGYAWFGERRECRTAILALLPAYRRRGLDSLLILNTIESAQRHGYVGGELSWVMEDNVVLKNTLNNLGAVIDKEYALFEKHI